MRQILAFLLAPLPAVLFVLLVGPHRSLVAQAVAMWGVVLMIQLVFGVFIRIELRRQGKNSLRWYALGGAIMLGLPAIAMLLLVPSARATPTVVWFLTISMIAVLGAVTGVTYALIAGLGRQRRIDAIDELARRFG